MRKALVIGIDNYMPNPLYCCVNDATEFHELISRNNDGSPNFESHLEKNVASRAKLRALIRELFSGYGDTVLLYFAGHGFVNELGGYIVTPDFRQNDEGVLMNELIEIANQSKAKDKIIILDCCFSGAIAAADTGVYHPGHISDGVTILAACRNNEVAKEKNGHGIFTELLLDGLKGGAADISGHITPGSIYSYIDRALGPWSQRPVFKTNVSRFTSLREVIPQISVDILRKLPEYFSEPEIEFSLNPSFEDTNAIEIAHEVIEPYALPANTIVFKHLQKLQSIGLVTPVGEDYMYFAAMKSKSCKLTPLGLYYWRLVNNGKI